LPCKSPSALAVEPRDERQQPEQHLLTLADRMEGPVLDGVGWSTEAKRRKKR
jgi:hypothetical protein